MSLFKKIAVGVSTVALPASMFFGTAAVTKAATAGGVYSTPDGTVWFVTKDMQKRAFTSAGAFLSYGFLNFSQVTPADASVTALPSGAFIAPADGKIFCATQTKDTDVAGECALITGSKKAAFTSAAVFAAQGHTFARAMSGDSSFLAKTANIDNGSAAHLPGVLVNNAGTVQMVVTGGLWGIPSQDVFNSWGYNYADVVPANAADTAKSQVGVIPARMAGELVPTGTTGGTPNPGTGPVDCSNDGSEGSVNTTSAASPEDTEALEGESDVEIYAVDVELNDDGDLCLDRVDLWFSQTATASDDPWDYFTDVSLLVNGEVIDTMDADSSSDWTEEANAGGGDTNGELATAATDNEFRIRFSGLDAGLASDETTTISVAVSMVNNLDSEDEDAVWVVEIDDDAGLRLTDGTGFTFTQELSSTTTMEDSFTTGAEQAATLSLSLADDTPDSSVVEISKTADTNDVHISTYTIEEDEGVDVNISEIKVDIEISDPAGGVDPAGAGTIVRRAYLVIDGDVVGTETVAATGDNVVVTFDGLDIDVDGDSEVDVEVHVDIDDTNESATPDRFDEGTQVWTDDFDVTEFEDETGNDEGDSNPAAVTTNGEAHELRTEGIMVEFVSQSAVKSFTADAMGEIDQGTFEITFAVTAFGDDMYIDRSTDVAVEDCASAEADAAGQGVEYCYDTTGTDSDITDLSALVSAEGSETGDNANVFQVRKDTTREVTLQLVGQPDADGAAQLRIESINYGTATDDTNANYYNFNLDDFKTSPYLFLNVF